MFFLRRVPAKYKFTDFCFFSVIVTLFFISSCIFQYYALKLSVCDNTIEYIHCRIVAFPGLFLSLSVTIFITYLSLFCSNNGYNNLHNNTQFIMIRFSISNELIFFFFSVYYFFLFFLNRRLTTVSIFVSYFEVIKTFFIT